MLLPEGYLPPNELDQFLFETLVPHDHYLRHVLSVVDFERCREELVLCYSPDHGRPAVEPVLLLKLEFLEYHYNLSDRQVIEQARYNMAFRYFLGLSLKSSLPHHTLLTVFRERLGVDKHQKVFDALVAQAREHGLVKDRLRLKDATHMIANIAIPSAVRLVAETRQRLLDAVRPYAPERVAQEEAQAATIHTTTEDLPGGEQLLQRVIHLRSIVTWVEALVAAGTAEQSAASDWQTLRDVLGLARKVVSDREQAKPEDQLISLQDPDARWGNHHGLYKGYKLDIAQDADSGLITAVNVLPANGDEARDAAMLIEHEETAHGNDVQAMSIDGIGFIGPLLREWSDPEGLGLEVFVPPPPTPKPTGYFTPDQFTLNDDGDVLTCPAGQTTRRRERNRHGTGWLFRFPHHVCAACPLLKQCLKELPPKKGRTATGNEYAKEYRAARAKAQTASFQEVRRRHWRIERTLGEMVRWHGARHARYRGQDKSLMQALLTGLVVNVKRLIKFVAAFGQAAAGTMRAELAGGESQG
jgi:transposase